MDVRLHSIIKHRILGYYYAILKRVFNSFYSYYYVDLFAGDGYCFTEIPKHLKPFLPNDFLSGWSPPYFSLFQYAKKNENLSFKCVFNDLDKEKTEKLKKILEPYKDYILEIGNEDANIYFKRALELIEKPNRPSLFYLDPTNHKDLKFSTIKKISEFEDSKTGRKPELIINLMAYSLLKALQRNTPQDDDTITESLGTDLWKVWKDQYMQRHKTHELFRDVFLKQLGELGYRTTYYCVESTKTKSPQYYLIFATYNDRIFSIHRQIEKKVEELKTEEWVKKTAIVDSMIEKIPIGQKPLDGYFA